MEPVTEPYAAGTETGTSVAMHAGFPNPAAERSGSSLSLDKLLVRHPGSTYFFRIRGHSWNRWGVFDGDIAIIDRALAPREHDLIVWWQEAGDFSLSPFKRASRQNIWGVVTAIIHPFGGSSRTQPS
ncbi:MAG TPA: S24 family peptidase [Candidatus Saccharimonadales bacterium]|jgi:DNA polymerase V